MTQCEKLQREDLSCPMPRVCGACERPYHRHNEWGCYYDTTTVLGTVTLCTACYFGWYKGEETRGWWN